jgi:Uma2 family endonuclease
LAVEIVTQNDVCSCLMIKVVNYLAAGTLVWLVYPDTRKIEIYTPGKPAKILHETDTLDGNSVLPDFTLPLQGIFAPLDTAPLT